MTTVDEEPDRLRRAECAALLGWSGLQAWWRQRGGDFPPETGTDDRGAYWTEEEIYRWAAASNQRRLVRLASLRYWPAAKEPAVYGGTRTLHGYVVQQWAADSGVIGLAWPLPSHWHDSADKILLELPKLDALVLVQSDFGITGPGLSVTKRTSTTNTDAEIDWRNAAHEYEWRDFGVQWQELAAVLGQPVPYWPFMLRIERLITAWKPGAGTVTYPTIPEVDTTPPLRLAATLQPDTPAYQALLYLVTVAQHRSTTGAESDLSILQECLQRHRTMEPEQCLVVAAVPMAVPEPANDEELDLAVLRAGWLEILDRTDQLAADCVASASEWDGGRYFPHASLEEVDPTTACGAEWSQRLQAVTEQKAVYHMLGQRETSDLDALVDPECDAPVVRKHNGKLLVAVPQRLPAAAPLAEVVLDSPIWIRTEDGMLWPAPRNEYFGLSWGYGGSGPGSLALLLHRLLDDITAPGADHVAGAAAGLDELTALKWPVGTVLTRTILEAARHGRPYRRPQAEDPESP